MKRTKFYKATVVDDIAELDFLYSNLSDFVLKYPVTYYRVTESDIPDPALISFRVYGTVDFFWLILLANNIEDAFTELTAGLLLTIPHKLDIFHFQKKFKLRR